jgi:sugar phosphate isomerase/epimerase
VPLTPGSSARCPSDAPARGEQPHEGVSAKPALTKTPPPVGQGTLDWKGIFTAAKTGGIRNYYVEMSLDMMRASVPYLQHLRV